jgi:indole-3-glycerol phosphate synthase
VQASPSWLPPVGTLGGILAETEERVRSLERRRSELEREAGRIALAPPPSFSAALRGPAIAVIAEVKRRSPSRGAIRPSISAAEQANAYAAGGAAAISVLTEPRHFEGSPGDLVDVRKAVTLPALKKDFHVDPIQLLEARALGASAALLIARALPPDTLASMVQKARSLSLEALVEVRTEDELERALDAGAAIIGVNNRDLETLVVDMDTCRRIVPRVPRGVLAVAESGIATRDDVERLAEAGIDAVLVGSSVSAARDPATAVSALVGVPRRQRAS